MRKHERKRVYADRNHSDHRHFGNRGSGCGARYLDLSRRTERAVAEGLVGSMRSALSIYFAKFVVNQKGTKKNFRDNVSIPNFMKVPGDSMGMTGSETMILEKRVTARLSIDNPSSIKDYDLGEEGISGLSLKVGQFWISIMIGKRPDWMPFIQAFN